MYLANNVYGMHAPPYMPGTAIGLLFHLLSGGSEGVQGFYGHVIGGMGSITGAMAEAVRAAGGEIRTSASVSNVTVRDGRATGVVLDGGEELEADIVLSNADPKRTFLGLVDAGELPEDFREDVVRDQDGRSVREGELRPVGGAGVDGHARRRGCQPPVPRDAGADARRRRKRSTTVIARARSPTGSGWTASPRPTSTTRSRPPVCT